MRRLHWGFIHQHDPSATASLRSATTRWFGACPLQRVIQQQSENPLAQAILKGELPEGSGIRIDFDGDEFTFGSFDPNTATVESVGVK